MSKSEKCCFFDSYRIGFAVVFAVDVTMMFLFTGWIIGSSIVLKQTADYRLNGKTYKMYHDTVKNYVNHVEVLIDDDEEVEEHEFYDHHYS